VCVMERVRVRVLRGVGRGVCIRPHYDDLSSRARALSLFRALSLSLSLFLFLLNMYDVRAIGRDNVTDAHAHIYTHTCIHIHTHANTNKRFCVCM
jgi:hypothetical protein